MSHDATKVVLGSTQSSFKKVENHKGNIEAGLIVRLKSDDTISIASADGAPLGISLGKDLSGIGFTSYVVEGTRVPVLLGDAFTPTIGAQVQIDNTSGKAVASGTGVNAVYVSSTLTGIKEDDTTANVALIDFPGGL